MLNQLDQQHLDNYKYLNDPTHAQLKQEEELNSRPNSPTRNTQAHSLLAYAENTRPNKSPTHFIEEKENKTQSVFFNSKSNLFYTLENDSRKYTSRQEPTADELTRDALTYALATSIDSIERKQARQNLNAFNKSMRADKIKEQAPFYTAQHRKEIKEYHDRKRTA